MREFTSYLSEPVEAMWRGEEERAAMFSADPDDETFRVQADGFPGPKKGFEDAERLRQQRQ